MVVLNLMVVCVFGFRGVEESEIEWCVCGLEQWFGWCVLVVGRLVVGDVGSCVFEILWRI